jgi:signal transduction histidine kinase
MFGVDEAGIFIDYKLADNFELLVPSEAFMGKHVQDVLPPAVAQQVLHNIQIAREAGKVQVFEYDLLMPDGLHDFEARVVAHEAERCYITVRDITERKQAEKHIREQARLLDLIFQHTPDSLALLDKDFNFIRVSESYAKAGQRDVSYFPGRNHFEVYPSDFQTEAEDVRQKKYVYSKLARPFVYADHPEWGVTYWNLGLVPILDQNADIELFLFTLRDVTQQVRAEKEINQLNEELEQRIIERTKELEEANAEIRHFAYIVSHDLRAPLVNLKGFSAELRSALKVLRDGYDEVLPQVDLTRRDLMMRALHEDIPEALRFIESSVDNMDSFTKAILKLSRLGRLQLELVKTDVRLIVEKTLDSLSHQIKQRGIKITIGELPVVTADFVSMEQVFGNILSNAVAYLVPNRPGEIEITAERQTDETIFRIRDNGRGIAKEDMDKVFAPFRRAGKQDVPGEGMGLAYVQTLVRRHGGRIWCESELGVGTTFTFTISNNLTNDSAVS